MMLPFLQTPLRYGPISPKQICMMGKDGYDGGDSYKNASTGLCREVSQEGSVSKDNGDDSSINNINKNEEKKLVFKPISAKDTTSLTNPSRDLLHDVLETKLNNIEGERRRLEAEADRIRALQRSRVQSQQTVMQAKYDPPIPCTTDSHNQKKIIPLSPQTLPSKQQQHDTLQTHQKHKRHYIKKKDKKKLQDIPSNRFHSTLSLKKNTGGVRGQREDKKDDGSLYAGFSHERDHVVTKHSKDENLCLVKAKKSEKKIITSSLKSTSNNSSVTLVKRSKSTVKRKTKKQGKKCSNIKKLSSVSESSRQIETPVKSHPSTATPTKVIPNEIFKKQISNLSNITSQKCNNKVELGTNQPQHGDLKRDISRLSSYLSPHSSLTTDLSLNNNTAVNPYSADVCLLRKESSMQPLKSVISSSNSNIDCHFMTSHRCSNDVVTTLPPNDLKRHNSILSSIEPPTKRSCHQSDGGSPTGVSYGNCTLDDATTASVLSTDNPSLEMLKQQLKLQQTIKQNFQNNLQRDIDYLSLYGIGRGSACATIPGFPGTNQGMSQVNLEMAKLGATSPSSMLQLSLAMMGCQNQSQSQPQLQQETGNTLNNFLLSRGITPNTGLGDIGTNPTPNFNLNPNPEASAFAIGGANNYLFSKNTGCGSDLLSSALFSPHRRTATDGMGEEMMKQIIQNKQIGRLLPHSLTSTVINPELTADYLLTSGLNSDILNTYRNTINKSNINDERRSLRQNCPPCSDSFSSEAELTLHKQLSPGQCQSHIMGLNVSPSSRPANGMFVNPNVVGSYNDGTNIGFEGDSGDGKRSIALTSSTNNNSRAPPMIYSPNEGDLILSKEKILLATSNDSRLLSNLLCFIRLQIEVFTATPIDVAARSRRGGIKRPIAVGRVGLRCIHCARIPPDDRAKGAVSYPQRIRIVHQSVRNWQRYHLMACSHIDPALKQAYKDFRTSRTHSGSASLQYWQDSCVNLGMVDTETEGIRYRNLNNRKSNAKVNDHRFNGWQLGKSTVGVVPVE